MDEQQTDDNSKPITKEKVIRSFETKEKVIKSFKTFDSEIISELHQEIAKLDKSVWRNPLPKYIFVGIAIFAGFSFMYYFLSLCTENFCVPKFSHTYNIIKLIDIFIYSAWALGVPSYFFWEYLEIFPYKLDSNQLADFKYTQELASKIWAALLLTFGICLYIKYGVKP